MADALLTKYDLYYTDPTLTQMGFMLAKDKGGTKLWRRDDERGLPESFAPGDISYANLSPDIQKVIAHRYMHGGLGALEFEVEDDELYQILRSLRTQNLDTRCKGKAYPGPKIVEPTMPTHIASDYNQATDYIDPGSQWTSEANAMDGNGATCATEPTVGGDVWSDWLELYIPAISCSQVRIQWDMEAGDVHLIDIDLYYDDAWNDLYQGTDGDGALSVKAIGSTKTVTGARMRIYNDNAVVRAGYIYVCEFYAESANFLGTPKCFCVFNDKQYFAKGNALLKLKDDFSGYEVVRAFANDITHLASFSDDNLYIAFGAANTYWYMDDATPSVFVESGLGAPDDFTKFCKVGTDLWGLILPNKIHKSSNPTDTGAWGGEITVGEAAYDVNDMWEHDGYLYCMKEEGTFYESGGSIYNPFPELKSITHADSGKNSSVFRAGLYFRMGNQQEWEIKGGVLTEVTPEIFAPGISQYAYPCVARAHDESWLYAIIKRAAEDLAILAGRWEYIAGRSRWIWHEIRSIDLTDVATAFVCSVEGRPYLYLGSTVATENVYKVYLPVTNDATADTGYKFHIGAVGSLWTPRYMTLLFAVQKRWQELFVRSLNLSGTNYINAYYSTDDGGTFPTLLKKFITSPEQTGAFTNIEATMMNLRFDFVSNSETVPPVLKYHNLKALTMMPSVAKFRHTVKCADNLLLKKNLQANTTVAAIAAYINGIRDKVCTLGDIDGVEHTVMVRIVHEVEVLDEETRRPARNFTIEATEV